MSSTVEDVFAYFEQMATSAGLSVRDEVGDGIQHIRVALAAREDAGLRLRWNRVEQILRFEISHGPPAGDIVGWLTLREEQCEKSRVPKGESPEDSIHDAIQYGLELMAPFGDGT